jgi:hypothetical protein
MDSTTLLPSRQPEGTASFDFTGSPGLRTYEGILKREASRSAIALQFVGVFLVANAGLFLLLGGEKLPALILSAEGVLFVALGWWAQKDPLPATILGLPLVVATAVLFGMWLVLGVCTLILLFALRAGISHRKLVESYHNGRS